jgi:polysaccharide deacetylase 2 family uncharacterized protein YibQ
MRPARNHASHPAKPRRWLAFFFLLHCISGFAADNPAGKPVVLPAISIVIDDLGNDWKRDRAVVELPGAIVCSILPHTAYGRELAKLAHSRNKEVMLHLPMEAVGDSDVGQGGITLDMTFKQFAAALQSDIESVPHIIGINNHMGSLLTQHPGHMLWLMSEINRRGNLFFIDSYTTETSVGTRIADENRVPNMRRDVFLDHDPDPAAIRAQFRRLLNKARKNGVALAIGHPYPETIAVLREELLTLDREGIRLLPVSQLISHHLENSKTWQAYSSLSRKAAKN